MANKKRVYFLIRKQHLNSHQVEAVMDMLRYDRAVVECNAPIGFYLLSTDSAKGPDVERWKSFAIDVAFVGRDVVDCDAFVTRDYNERAKQRADAPVEGAR